MQPKSLRTYRSGERKPIHRESKTVDTPNITAEEVEKEIKNAIIKEDGRNYYADLYLLKKGRDKIINSLSNVGKFSLDQ